ncbi:hypothetical protein [Pseudomonas syringae]|uniref:hypothetical protein n=1 Tax=Pseudomonas syringae TaxID=317 RepID=UPI0013BE9773|nr:hypothetical protein [Pseudomonas syringae]
MTKKSERYFKKIKIVNKNSQMEQKGDPDSDFSQSFFIFGNFVHACCFITHMMTATLAENRGTRIKGNKACDPGGRCDGPRVDLSDNAQNATTGQPGSAS